MALWFSLLQLDESLNDPLVVQMLSLIGETLEDDNDICGAVVSVRKAQDRIAIWSATAQREDLQKAIGRGFRQALVDFGKNETLKYQSHADAAASGSSFQNEVYVVHWAVLSSMLPGLTGAAVVPDCMKHEAATSCWQHFVPMHRRAFFVFLH